MVVVQVVVVVPTNCNRPDVVNRPTGRNGKDGE